MRFNPKPLIAAVKASMDIPPFVPGEGPPRAWLRPPLVTDMMLCGLKLSEYTNFARKTRHDTTYLLDVAERYLAVFVLYPQDYAEDGIASPGHWIRANLEIEADVDAWLFPLKVPAAVRDDVWRHFATLLWWISGHGGNLAFDDKNIVCTIDGFRIGVENKRIVAPLLGEDAVDYEVNTPDWRPYLTEIQPGAATYCRNLAWNRIFRQAHHLPNRAEVQMALLILHARVRDKHLILKHLYPPKDVPSNTPLHRMGKMADELRTHPDPYKRLKDFMVPRWMASPIFRTVFPKPKKEPDALLRAAWRDFLYEEFDLYSYHHPSRRNK